MPPDKVPAGTISVGQSWADAATVARANGYELNDASHLEYMPPQDGFYLDLPGNRGLLVCRRPGGTAVSSIDAIDRWDGPKAFRVHHELPRFAIPSRTDVP
jgi:hypothetical protein